MSDLFFRRLVIEDWRQFAKVEMDFHRHLTVITGTNGSGKSTILRILAQHFGWASTMISSPIRDRSGTLHYRIRRSRKRSNDPSREDLGIIEYSSGHRSKVWAPVEPGVQYSVQFDSMATVNGVNVQAHRPPPTYNQVTTIPTNPLVPELAYNNFFNEVRGREQGNYNVGGSLLRLKEALISMAMFGPGNVNVSPNEQLNRTFLEFGAILQKLLPPEIGFRKIAVHLPDVVVETSSGTFVLDAASGGLMSIIEIAWQVFLFSRFHEQFTVLIDEPENHLHPSMQRQVLGALVSAFPDVQFIVATHSPFIISSVEDSHVYVLQSHENRTSKGGIIRSERLNLDEKAGTANDVLRDVLGVSITLPIWAASSLENIAKNFTFDDLTRDRLDELRTKLAEAGLSELYPETLAKISEQ